MTVMQEIKKAFVERVDENELMNCMRCGFCLPSCPTYIQSGEQEIHSPRGRIAMMKAVRDGMIEADEEMRNSLDVCLGCRACEPVCPAGVQYGHLLEESRAILQEHTAYSATQKAVRHTVFHELFPKNKQMNRVVNLVGFYQRSGLQKGVRKVGFLKLFPKGMQEMERVLPPVQKEKKRQYEQKVFEAVGNKTATVAFFAGCLMDTMFNETNRATIKLLQMAGCEVHIPSDQGCCGALHGHAGEKDQAIEMAKRNISAFESMEADYIVLNAGGCGAYLAGYDHLLKDRGGWQTRAHYFASRVRDFSTVLIEKGLEDKVNLVYPSTVVTYQDSCHLRNGMNVFHEPRQLLRQVEGVEYREMPDASGCCGSAGIYTIVQPDMSLKIVDDKMEKAITTNPGVIVTANPGCLLQMKVGIERSGLAGKVEAVHLADFLLEALS
ncbi:hypothetical protein KR50_01830 [Jeotgalibacillus campisalis]|uniref:Glycolate oxidase iron-sulfur subunit n=2 Tax=Jeotgalibacillus campisalis TaxID=220754 RepID=A0A0C2SFZ4_9BACL|nr:hypothetical protein KR50_01830 [Jeotgalibacillus campisalis]